MRRVVAPAALWLSPSLILAIVLMLVSVAIISQMKDPEPVSTPVAT